ncbi:MAG TPA: histidine kinase [Verrucomicrobiae bacterium]|nr:histidine kinase [Verrucomicrobiae bacterium]
MNRPNPLREQLALWGLVLGLWCLLVLAFAAHLVFTNDLALPQAMMLSLRDWAPWAALAPAVAWLAFRFPLERRTLVTHVPVHVLACMLTVVLCELVARPAGAQLGAGPNGPSFEGRRAGEPNEAPPFAPGPPPFRPLPGRPGPGGGRPPVWRTAFGRAQFSIPIYWVIVSIVHTLNYYRRSEERALQASELNSRLTEAKLQALRTQLHPHFLFNTLNAISTLIHKDPHAADEMLANLSELLRATLDTSQQEITLRQELSFLDRYLEIQLARFGDRLRVEKEIDTTALEGLVPTLILQPLVENAIRHGIEPQSGTGRLSIRAHRAGANLEIDVEDNGPGFRNDSVPQEGIGLANTRARLQELYANDARLVLKTKTDSGCSVEIILPFHQ